MNNTTNTRQLLYPEKLWSREEILQKPSPVPKQPGVYAWYFKDIPPELPVTGCHIVHAHTLLYVGISPKAPPKNGAEPSKQKLYDRVRYHYQGSAEGSTLRLSLGCLLSGHLGIQLRRVGSGNIMTFADGEAILSRWMQENAYVTWVIDPEPWKLKENLMEATSLPLNLDMNHSHPFHETLSQIRKTAKATARELPVI